MLLRKWCQNVLWCCQHGELEHKGAQVNTVPELEKLKKPKVFKGMNEVAVKIEQQPDDIGHAPEHEPFAETRKHRRAVEKY